MSAPRIAFDVDDFRFHASPESLRAIADDLEARGVASFRALELNSGDEDDATMHPDVEWEGDDGP